MKCFLIGIFVFVTITLTYGRPAATNDIIAFNPYQSNLMAQYDNLATTTKPGAVKIRTKRQFPYFGNYGNYAFTSDYNDYYNLRPVRGVGIHKPKKLPHYSVWDLSKKR